MDIIEMLKEFIRPELEEFRQFEREQVARQ